MANAGYAQPTEDLPVATLVTDDAVATEYQQLNQHLNQASAPVEPVATATSSGGGCCAAAASKPPATAPPSSNSCTNNYLDSDPTVSRFPMNMRECPNCHRASRTRVVTKPSCKTWVAFGIMTGVFWPLCWVPLVSDSCKETEHFCTSCGAKVAKVRAFQDCCVEHRG